MPLLNKFIIPAGLLLALILPIFAIAPLFYPGYFQTHSGFAPLWNVADWHAHRDGLGWVPHVAIHFDPLRSDGLLPYYLAGWLALPPVTAVKVILALGWLLGSAGMWLWLKNWLGPRGALLAALVYTYLPYHIAAVYVRGAWGEALFWGLLPWAMWVLNIDKINRIFRFRLTNKRGEFYLELLVPAIIWFLLALSQLGLTFWAGLLAALLLWLTRRRVMLWSGLAALLGVIGGVGLYLALTPFPTSSPVVFTDHFLYPSQLFSAYWGFGPSRPGWNDGLSLQVGLAVMGLTMLTLFVWWSRRQESKFKSSGFLPFFLIAAFILILLQFDLSARLWRLPLAPGYVLADTLTYPWQLLGLVGLCLSVVAGAGVRLDEQLTRLPIFSGLLLFVLLGSYSYLSPKFTQPDPYLTPTPPIILGDNQAALLAHDFSVVINGRTAGLEQGQTTIPLAVHAPLQANNVLRLNVVWQPLQPFSQNFKVFVHLVDPFGQVIAQYDGQPKNGEYPTDQWIPGELIKDSYPLVIPANAPAGPYRVYLGLYDEANLARLPVPGDAEGRVVFNVR